MTICQRASNDYTLLPKGLRNFQNPGEFWTDQEKHNPVVIAKVETAEDIQSKERIRLATLTILEA